MVKYEHMYHNKSKQNNVDILRMRDYKHWTESCALEEPSAMQVFFVECKAKENLNKQNLE